MTVSDKPPRPEQLTVIEIFHQTLAEAKLSKVESVSAALMFFGIVLCRVTENEGDAHIAVCEAAADLHNFIHDNYGALARNTKGD